MSAGGQINEAYGQDCQESTIIEFPYTYRLVPSTREKQRIKETVESNILKKLGEITGHKNLNQIKGNLKILVVEVSGYSSPESRDLESLSILPENVSEINKNFGVQRALVFKEASLDMLTQMGVNSDNITILGNEKQFTKDDLIALNKIAGNDETSTPDLQQIYNLLRRYNDGQAADIEGLDTLKSIMDSKKRVEIRLCYEKISSVTAPSSPVVPVALPEVSNKTESVSQGESGKKDQPQIQIPQSTNVAPIGSAVDNTTQANTEALIPDATLPEIGLTEGLQPQISESDNPVMEENPATDRSESDDSDLPIVKTIVFVFVVLVLSGIVWLLYKKGVFQKNIVYSLDGIPEYDRRTGSFTSHSQTHTLTNTTQRMQEESEPEIEVPKEAFISTNRDTTIIPQHLEILTIVSSRGGSGRTSLVASFAHMLASCGFKTLLVDMDILTHGLTYLILTNPDTQIPNTMSRMVAKRSDLNIVPLMVSDQIENNLFILPSATLKEKQRWNLDKTLNDQTNLTAYLRKILTDIRSQYGFDYVIVDPESGVDVLSVSSALAADSYVVVTESDRPSWNMNDQLLVTLREAAPQLDHHFHELGFVINKNTLPEDAIVTHLAERWKLSHLGTLAWNEKVKENFQKAMNPIGNHPGASWFKSFMDLFTEIYLTDDWSDDAKAKLNTIVEQNTKIWQF
ncbi:MAG: ParA family protein [SAR324 cluster bacterium]|nr:ParA family protein [SAR324 cluster bacterium]